MQRGCLAAYVFALFVDVCLFLMFMNVSGCDLPASLCVPGWSWGAAFCHPDLLSGGRARWAGDGRLPGTEAVVPLCHLCPACFTLLPVIPCLLPNTISAPCSPCSLSSVKAQHLPQNLFLWWCPRSCSGCVCQAAPDLWLMILSSGTSEVWFDVAGNVFPQDFLQTPAQEQTLMPESVREVGPKTKMRH